MRGAEASSLLRQSLWDIVRLLSYEASILGFIKIHEDQKAAPLSVTDLAISVLEDLGSWQKRKRLPSEAKKASTKATAKAALQRRRKKKKQPAKNTKANSWHR